MTRLTLGTLLAAIALTSVSSGGAETTCGHADTSMTDPRGIPEWYLRARFGMFYHWGARSTGYGRSIKGRESPFKPDSLEEFERMAPSPDELAEKLVGLTKKVGARYLIFTVLHSSDRYTVYYPTEVPYFKMKTRQDYVGAVIKEAHREGIKFIMYTSTVPGHYDSKGGPWIDGLTGSGKSEESTKRYMGYVLELIQEMKNRYAGIGGIDGVWIDGSTPNTDFVKMKEVLPEGVFIGNNLTRFPYPGSYMAALEGANAEPEPAYNRPSAHRLPRSPRFQPPLSDYCEDIPNMGTWHFQVDASPEKGAEYVNDHRFWVREMISSLGQRRKWNYATGIGPTLNGEIPEIFQPSVETMARFMEWASPAIYNTVGGEGAPLRQGWMNDGAFSSLTVSLDEEDTYYLFVTSAPLENSKDQDIPAGGEEAETKDVLIIQHYWVEVESITDMRTGSPQTFEMDGSINLTGVDWSDVDEYGAKVFKIKLVKH